MKTECLVSGAPSTTIEVKVRFLQMAERDGRQEGMERDTTTPPATLESLAERPLRREFLMMSAEDTGGRVCETIHGEIELTASRCESVEAFRLTLQIRNLVDLEDAADLTRDAVLLRSLVSVHSILRVVGGEFISLLDPPEQFCAAVAECRNSGAWPVLAGEEGQRDLVLASPIILYDYPQIAPESPGDLFDGTEIDEILALRILTMTDAEKLEVRKGDDRARRILERTEVLPPEHFQKLHGALRGLRPATSSSQEAPQ